MSRSNRHEINNKVSVISPLRTFLNETTQAGQHSSYPTPIHRPACGYSHASAEYVQMRPAGALKFQLRMAETKLGTLGTLKRIRSSGLEERCTCNALVMGSNPIGYFSGKFH